MCQTSRVAPPTFATSTFPFGKVNRRWPSSLPVPLSPSPLPSLPSSCSSFARSAHR